MSQNKRIANNCFYFSHMMKKNCLSEEVEDDDNSSKDSTSVV